MSASTDNRVLSQLMLLQGTLVSMPTDESISRFVFRGLKSVPGVSSLNVCIRGAVAERHDLCVSCNYRWGKAEDNFDHLCKLEDDGNTKYLPIRNSDHLYGFVVFSLNNTPEAFIPYEPYLHNIVNVIATTIENRQQRELLEAFNKQLQREVEHRKQTEEALRRDNIFIEALFESIPGMLYVYDDQGTHIRHNKKHEEMTGYSEEELSLLNPLSWYDDEADIVRVEAAINDVFTTGYGEVDAPMRIKNGEKLFMHFTGSRLIMDGKKYFVGVGIDISGRKQAEEKIEYMAYHDSLTGLPNRKLFSDRLGITLAQRNQKIVGIAMLDLDNFKGVNDTLGHVVGDLLLKATAERLSASLRKGDTLARFGGDEFMLILPGLMVIEDAIQVAQKIVDSFRKPFFIENHHLVVTTSIGIAVYPNDGTNEGILLKNADKAMYQAKQAGRDRYQLYKEV